MAETNMSSQMPAQPRRKRMAGMSNSRRWTAISEDLRRCNEVNGAGNHQPRNFISIFRTLKKFTFLP
jgi:hypothetical protein